jgi:sporulation protein YlmC with PRC-barrel domain
MAEAELALEAWRYLWPAGARRRAMAAVESDLQTPSGIPCSETSELISSSKVEGTPVYRSNGENIGRIECVMIDKRTGRVAYAVLSFGGFLGLGEDHYPLPWSLLSFNEKLGGYEVNISEDQLKGAPRYGNAMDWEKYESGQLVYEYYGQPPYWM